MKKKTTRVAPPSQRARPGRRVIPADPKSFGGRLGARIRSARQALGWTQSDAAKKTGGLVSAALWSSYESGTVPGLSKFLLVCVALGARLDELLPADARDMIGKPFNLLAARAALGVRAK